MNKTLLAALAGGALGISGAVQAAPVIMDIDGNFNDGGYAADNTISYDVFPGNALAMGSVPISAVGQTFDMVFQAEMQSILQSANVNLPVANTGVFEITVVMTLQEKVDTIVDSEPNGIPDIVQFGTVGGTFELWYDNFIQADMGGVTVDANDIDAGANSGLGYRDGVMILQGNVLPAAANSTYTLEQPEPQLGLLDQHGPNDLGGIQTITGNGSTDFDIQVTSVDANFFLNPPASITMTLNSTLSTPFGAVNPSTSVLGNAPNYGSNNTNGLWDSTGTEDFHFEADGNGKMNAAVPAPGSILLLGSALGLMGGFARRRKA